MSFGRAFFSATSCFRSAGFSGSLSLTLPGCRILWAAYEQETTDMANGTVKFFNTQKGFGFIETFLAV